MAQTEWRRSAPVVDLPWARAKQAASSSACLERQRPGEPWTACSHFLRSSPSSRDSEPRRTVPPCMSRLHHLREASAVVLVGSLRKFWGTLTGSEPMRETVTSFPSYDQYTT